MDVEVTQADRDAAAELVRNGAPGVSNGNRVIADEIKGGLHDSYHIVQLFARHRATAHAAGFAEGVERAAVVAEMHDHRGDIAQAIRALKPSGSENDG